MRSRKSREFDSWLLWLITGATSRDGVPGKGAAPAGPLGGYQIALPEPRSSSCPRPTPALSQALSLLRGELVTIVNTARGEPPEFLRTLRRERGEPGFLFLSGLSFVIVGADFLIGLKRRRSWHALGQSTTLTLRKEMIAIPSQDLSFFDSASSAEMIQLIDRDCERSAALSPRLRHRGGQGAVLIVSASFLFAASPTLLALIALLAPLLILPGVCFKTDRSTRRAADRSRARASSREQPVEHRQRQELLGRADGDSHSPTGARRSPQPRPRPTSRR